MLCEITSLASLYALVAEWKQSGQRIALVPTMGALHAGHLALVREAQNRADKVVVSIFVNPTQFGPNEDFAKYPRTVKDDIAALTAAGADALWLPTVEIMYPDGPNITVHMDGLANRLEGVHRPGHFDGVATVVSALFSQVQPDIAVFGEKDYQQLAVIKRMVSQLGITTHVIGLPTVREADGLAMSSRNRYLSQPQRQIATRLNQVLRHSAHVLKHEGRDVAETLRKAERFLIDAGFRQIDYLALCDADTLEPMTNYRPNTRLLAAAWLGSTRLIDNIAV